MHTPEIPASATLIDVAELGTPGYSPINITTAAAHHGVAVSVNDIELVITMPDGEGGALPVGVEVTDHDGLRIETFEGCPGLHGEAASSSAVVFGCSDGVLAVSKATGTWTASKIANPEGTPEGQRVGTVKRTRSDDIFLGNFGATGLVEIDVAAGSMTPIDLQMEYYQFGAPETGEGIVVRAHGASKPRLRTALRSERAQTVSAPRPGSLGTESFTTSGAAEMRSAPLAVYVAAAPAASSKSYVGGVGPLKNGDSRVLPL